MLAVLLTLFVLFNRVPKLDTVRQDLAAVAAPTAECFQGFCIEGDPDASLLSRWWAFSMAYLRLVTVGMTFAFLVAGLTEVFLFPNLRSPGFSVGGIRGTLKGLVVGVPMTLCSACIVPVSSAFRRRGAGIESTLAIAQGSATLNLPAIIMAAMVFTPMLAGSRILLSLAGALLIGPVVAFFVRRHGVARESDRQAAINPPIDDPPWREILTQGLRDWILTSIRYLIRLGPIMVVAGFASAFVIQWITPQSVGTYLGDSLTGILIAATVGILINVPLMFEIPLVAALLLVGMGTAPAATLLFTAAAAGPITFWGLAKVMPRRAIVAFGTSTWIVGVTGGLAVLALSLVVPSISTSGSEVRALAKRGEAVGQPVSAQAPAGGDSVRFTDVTESAGLNYIQYALRPDGSCLLDGGLTGTGDGKFCLPERMSGGAAAADYDNDGYVDLFVTRLDAPDILFRNMGDDRFEDRSREAGLSAFNLRSNGAAWIDVDNDGDMDLYVTTIADTRYYLFINDGSGRFTEEAVARGAAIASSEIHIGYSVAVGDFDVDGWPDLHITEWGSASVMSEGSASHARLLRNRGADAPGHFLDVTVEAGVVLDDVRSRNLGGFVRDPLITRTDEPGPKGPFAFASAFADLDGDGWPDLAVVSDYGMTRIFWNNGDGTFTDGTVEASIGSDRNGMGSTFGDYDGDGDLDWFVSSIFAEYEQCESLSGCGTWDSTGNRLYRNDGGRSFSDATDEAGVRDGGWGWGSVFFDFDNDGDLDLAMVGGMHHSATFSDRALDSPTLWENDGTGRMTDVSEAVGLTHPDASKGFLTFDYDNDGDLDLFVVNNGGAPRLYRNDGGNGSPWLRVRLIGDTSNRSAIGVRLIVTATQGGASQLREAGVRSHFLGQSEVVEHFGLGEGVTVVDRVSITWPATGHVTVLRDVPADGTIIVREGRSGYEIQAIDGVN